MYGMVYISVPKTCKKIKAKFGNYPNNCRQFVYTCNKKGVYLLQNKSIGLQIVKLFELIGLLLPDLNAGFHL